MEIHSSNLFIFAGKNPVVARPSHRTILEHVPCTPSLMNRVVRLMVGDTCLHQPLIVYEYERQISKTDCLPCLGILPCTDYPSGQQMGICEASGV